MPPSSASASFKSHLLHSGSPWDHALRHPDLLSLVLVTCLDSHKMQSNPDGFLLLTAIMHATLTMTYDVSSYHGSHKAVLKTYLIFVDIFDGTD